MLSFAALAQCFEELEHTSSRKQLTTLLADLLEQVEADEIAEVSYLLQGRVAPLYEPVEFGLGERSIEKAVALAFDVPQTEVRQKDAAAGDIGLVVAELATAAGRTEVGEDRPVREVFADLRALADLSGSGSADAKVAWADEAPGRTRPDFWQTPGAHPARHQPPRRGRRDRPGRLQ